MFKRDYIPGHVRYAAEKLYGKSTCHVCGQVGATQLHHVVPCYAGGKSTFSNLVPVCSNTGGPDTCHAIIHSIIRKRESSANPTMTTSQYWDVVAGLSAMLRGSSPVVATATARKVTRVHGSEVAWTPTTSTQAAWLILWPHREGHKDVVIRKRWQANVGGRVFLTRELKQIVVQEAHKG